ncbi:MAG TPA: peroxidase family protein [Parvularculaceae bacterium]|nr:peroxidase family protein [Parvularculaceae bacterium]HNS86546.1 peroxidase family protein [Parvularculaceae bacterium]
MSKLFDFAARAAGFLLGKNRLNDLIVNRLVGFGRARPHPWSTKFDYVSWSGLSDRTYYARLLPPKPYPPEENVGGRRPPLSDVRALFACSGEQRRCPKSTVLFPAFAQYLTDGFLRTRLQNDPPFGSGVEERARTTSNHDIDQSPLYGRNEAQTRALRTLSGGRLKSQILDGEEHPLFLYDGGNRVRAEFCDAAGAPILDQPLGVDRSQAMQTLFAVGGDRVNATPQVAMLNTLFLREHNRLAGLLMAKNPDWDDDRLFETARNSIIVMFIKIVVEEYINHINTTNIAFSARPQPAWRARWNRPNWMTAEFSLLYRWHALIPERMDWNGADIHGRDLLLDNSLLLKGGLADAFVAVSGNAAAELSLQNTASFLLDAEQRGVAQAREVNIAPYNDYREAMKLRRQETFADIVGSSNDAAEAARKEALAARLEQLYGSADNFEFFVGLFAEPRGENGPLPELITRMVAMDAFSQALTNPLLSEPVWGDREVRRLTFTDIGLDAIENTASLRDILERNSTDLGDRFVGMTRRDWKRQ